MLNNGDVIFIYDAIKESLLIDIMHNSVADDVGEVLQECIDLLEVEMNSWEDTDGEDLDIRHRDSPDDGVGVEPMEAERRA